MLVVVCSFPISFGLFSLRVARLLLYGCMLVSTKFRFTREKYGLLLVGQLIVTTGLHHRQVFDATASIGMDTEVGVFVLYHTLC